MTTTTASALTIECAKPDCSWRGSPADAPTHPCPTPAVADPANKIANKSHPEIGGGSGFATTDAAAGGRFAQERADIEARLDDAGVSYSKDLGLDELKGLAQLLVDEPATPAGVEATPSGVEPEPTLGDPVDAIAEHTETDVLYESDPETLDEHAAWLAAHGAYDAKGVPSDERTATLDARYGVLLAEAGEAVDDGQADEPEVVHPEPADAVMPNQHVQPWQTVIAAALAAQGSVPAYKWLVVWHPADPSREAELLGRGKTKNEAVVIAEDTGSRVERVGEVAVVKTADVLNQAEALLAATGLDPDQEESDAAPPAEKEAAAVEEAPVAATPAPGEPGNRLGTRGPTAGNLAETTLFDPADYRDPSLALPQIDGHDIDRIAVQFTGEIMLDRSDKDHVALWRGMKLGREVELWVQVKGSGFSGKGATSKDGELDVVVAKRTVSVLTVRVLGPEDLKEAALEVASLARDAAEAQDARDRRPNDA